SRAWSRGRSSSSSWSSTDRSRRRSACSGSRTVFAPVTRGFATTLAAGLAVLLIAAPAAAGSTKTYTYKFGPISVGPYQALKKSSAVKTPPVTGSIVRMDANVVDSSGRVIPQSQVMLHHLVFFNNGRPGARRRDGACPTHNVGERFYGTSEELRALTMPAGYGYRFDRREKWGTAWMLMNHTHQDRRAFVRYRVTVDTS